VDDGDEQKKREPVRGEDAVKFELDEMRGARVVVRANGFIYRGILVGADENDLYLKGELRYLVLPLATVTSLELEKPSAHLGLPTGFKT
jgi:hypothetical protein